jgi:hypothetical protein
MKIFANASVWAWLDASLKSDGYAHVCVLLC